MELDSPTLLPLVREAVADRRPLQISYYSASTDRVTDREIAPLRLFASEGHWYVDAWCQTAGDLRRFRVDRIGTAETLDTRFLPRRSSAVRTGPRGVGPTPTATQKQRPDGADRALGARPVRSRSRQPSGATLPRSGHGLAGRVRSGHRSGHRRSGDRIEVELFVGGDAWLERLLLRLGPDARVIEPPELPVPGRRGRRPDPSSAMSDENIMKHTEID